MTIREQNFHSQVREYTVRAAPLTAMCPSHPPQTRLPSSSLQGPDPRLPAPIRWSLCPPILGVSLLSSPPIWGSPQPPRVKCSAAPWVQVGRALVASSQDCLALVIRILWSPRRCFCGACLSPACGREVALVGHLPS